MTGLLRNVRHLTLNEIAQMWITELDIHESVLLRELQIAVINIPRIRNGEDLLEMAPPPDADLPDPHERVDREWLQDFCHKQGWAEPEFWYPRIPEIRRQGRPSVRASVLQKFEERKAANQTEATISEEARQIHVALMDDGIGGRIPEPKTIQGHIRSLFNAD